MPVVENSWDKLVRFYGGTHEGNGMHILFVAFDVDYRLRRLKGSSLLFDGNALGLHWCPQYARPIHAARGGSNMTIR